NTLQEGGTRGNIGVAERSITHQRLDLAPFASRGPARVQLAPNLTTRRPISRSLTENGSTPHDRHSGSPTFGRNPLFDSADILQNQLRKRRSGKVLEPRRTDE